MLSRILHATAYRVCVSPVASPSPRRRLAGAPLRPDLSKDAPRGHPSPGRHKFRGFARQIFHAASAETPGAGRLRHPIEEGSASLTRRRGVGPMKGSAAHAAPANAACLCASRQGLSAGFPFGAQGCPSGAQRIARRPGGSVPVDGEDAHCRQKQPPYWATVSSHAATGREERRSRPFAVQPS